MKVRESISTNTGVAPKRAAISAVAKNVNGGTNTASPGPTPKAINAMSKASEPDAQLMQCSEPVKEQSDFSSSSISGPII